MLKKIYYENFKSFDKAEILFENVTTLIGTNASGKTNMIEGMMILSEIMTGRDLTVILDGSKNQNSEIRGGAKGCCRLNSNYFILGCTIGFDDQIDLEYRIKICVSERIFIEKENLFEIKNGEKKPMFYTKEINHLSGDVAVAFNNGLKGRNPDISCIRVSAVITQIITKLSLETKYGKKIVEYSIKIIDILKNVLFLNPETSSMRSYSLLNDIDLKVNASNISSVLYNLCKTENNKKMLLDIMKMLPENEIIDITFAEGQLNDIILFLIEKVGSKFEKIDAIRLSDGTLRCLAVVAAILSEKSGSIIVIEEVDNGIHPGRAKMLIKVISSIARKRGVDLLITTHNAVMLNALDRQDLSGVEVVYRDDENGDGKFIPLVKIKDMPALLANGKLGDVFTNDVLLQFIKEDTTTDDYKWLEV